MPALSLALAPSRLFPPSSFNGGVEGDDRAAGMIARAKFQGQCTSPGIERAIPAGSRSDLFLLPESYVLALVFRKNFTIHVFLSFFVYLD